MEILNGHDGERIWRAFNDSSRANHDLLFRENNDTWGNLQSINQATSTKEIRERLEIAQKAFEQLEQGIRKMAMQEVQQLEKYLGGDQWKQTSDNARKNGVDPEFIDAVLRGQRVLNQAVLNNAGAVAMYERLYIIYQRIDRVCWEFANPRNQPSRISRLNNTTESVSLATGLHIQRNQDGVLQIRIESNHWASLDGAGRLIGALSIGNSVGISQHPDGRSWILWGTDNRSASQIFVTSAPESRQKEGYGLQRDIVSGSKRNTYFARRAN